jgi:2-phospho-L-lactate/phosphoenolpyruvate guanylyltransferase
VPVEDVHPSAPTVVAIVPIGRLEGAKSRLGAVLDAEERYELVTDLAERTIRAVVATPGIAETMVVTPDDAIRTLALAAGARPLLQRTRGLNDGLREARDEAIAGGAAAILIVPVDLPAVSPATLGAVLDVATDPHTPLVVLITDRHGRGTNALFLRPADAIDVRFGGDSRAAHRAAALAAGARYVELDSPLAVDIDTPDDLLLVEAGDPDLARG